MNNSGEFPCPSCRRGSQVDPAADDPVLCPRCGCELSTLAALRRAAATRTQRATAALAAGFATEAARLASESWSLHRNPETATCGFLAAVLKGDPALVSLWKQRLDSR